ncbi:hypothetical protein ASE00_04660 [Sphingomonas sp. Root710]|uniref:tetratricopeptide repeat protein n=1 Tax=Sphingomonas sp. Root710 TaxID=1736594 RepID=UPI0006FDC285|nr:tetratricopeptide repeat protein [Sphingomonas sp. Root710]KRB86041.1 hypothetical protein ASE00_04660 [Sphingomonas sp. Root710]
MTKDSAANKGFSLPFARVALILAALIALAAVAIATMRSGSSSSESPSPEAMPAAGDLSAAISGLEKKLAANPDNAENWNLLGLGYYNVGRYADAVKAYARATSIDPNNAVYWSALGEVQVLTGPGGVIPQAEASFKKALAIDPKDFRARYFLAVKRNEGGDSKGAVDQLISLLNDSPAGASWEQPVRDLIAKISTDNKIDITGRLRPPSVAQSPTPAPVDNVATGGIPGPTAADLKAATGMTPSEQDDMARGMVARLAARLEANPRDADRWIMLIRSRMQLNDPAGARSAVNGAKAAFKDDPRQQARFDQAAQMLGVPGK